MYRRRYVIAGMSAALLFLVLMFVSPFLAEPGAYVHLDGSPGVIDHHWSLTEFAYLAGDFLCHQEMDRSIILNGSQMPFCVRDTGLLVGFVLGMAACVLLGRRLSDRRYCAAGILMISVTALQWMLQDYILDSFWLRFATGTVSGFGVALFACWLLYRE